MIKIFETNFNKEIKSDHYQLQSKKVLTCHLINSTRFSNLFFIIYLRLMFGSSNSFNGSNLKREELMLNLRNDGGGPSK